MAEVSFLFDQEKAFSDIKKVNGDILLGDDLQTAVEVSMFSNARALTNPDELVRETISILQGWWADSLETEPLGSLFWTFRRRKETQEVLNGVDEAFTDSLQWLVADGVVTSAAVTTEFVGNGRMKINALLVKPDTTEANFTWQFAWEPFE